MENPSAGDVPMPAALPPTRRAHVAAAAVTLAAGVPLFLAMHRVGAAFLAAFNFLIVQSAGNILPGAVPASDGWMMAGVCAVCLASMKWAYAAVARAISGDGRAAVLPLPCLWAVVAFADGINRGFAVLMVGAFGLAVLFELAVNGAGVWSRPRDGLHGRNGGW